MPEAVGRRRTREARGGPSMRKPWFPDTVEDVRAAWITIGICGTDGYITPDDASSEGLKQRALEPERRCLSSVALPGEGPPNFARGLDGPNRYAVIADVLSRRGSPAAWSTRCWAATDVTPVFHPAATRDRPVFGDPFGFSYKLKVSSRRAFGGNLGRGSSLFDRRYPAKRCVRAALVMVPAATPRPWLWRPPATETDACSGIRSAGGR